MAYELKVGDNRPKVRFPAEEADGEPVDVSEADEINVTVADEDGNTVVSSTTTNADFDTDVTNTTEDGKEANNILTWYPDDTTFSSAGRYELEFEVIWNQGQSDEYSRHFPADASDNIALLVDPTL